MSYIYGCVVLINILILFKLISSYLQEALNISCGICFTLNGCCKYCCCNEFPENLFRKLTAAYLYCFDLDREVCSGSLDSEVSGVSLDTKKKWKYF